MNTELKLQALLDGELDAREVREMEALLASSNQHAALTQELKWTKAALAGSETAVTLPESREFYWGKISRAIETEERNAVRVTAPGRSWWLKLLYPATGLAAMVAVMFVISGSRSTDGADTETITEDVNAVSFRSDSEKMSVIYVSDEAAVSVSPAGQEVKDEPEADK
jgi:anti-sigma factor RsiW